MDSGYTTEEIELLVAIRAAVLANPKAYQSGAEFLRTEYGPEKLHRDAMDRWRSSDHALAKEETKNIGDPVERKARFDNVLKLLPPPKSELWTPAACICRAFQSLQQGGDVHFDAKAQAIALLAVMLWDADADKRHPFFSMFGPWGVTHDGRIESVSRWAAESLLEDHAARKNWMKTLRIAWTGLLPSGSTGKATRSSMLGSAGACAEQMPQCDPRARHSDDYTFVHWFGAEYQFAQGAQASIVKVLWEEWTRSGLGLHQSSIAKAVDAERDSFRVDKSLRGNPALGVMIKNCGDGRYRLSAPDA